jgi:hypothetical protein
MQGNYPQTAILWLLIPCWCLSRHRRFGEECCLYFQHWRKWVQVRLNWLGRGIFFPLSRTRFYPLRHILRKPPPLPNRLRLYVDQISSNRDNESRMFFRNVRVNLQSYVVSKPRRLQYDKPPLFKLVKWCTCYFICVYYSQLHRNIHGFIYRETSRMLSKSRSVLFNCSYFFNLSQFQYSVLELCLW